MSAVSPAACTLIANVVAINGGDISGRNYVAE